MHILYSGFKSEHPSVLSWFVSGGGGGRGFGSSPGFLNLNFTDICQALKEDDSTACTNPDPNAVGDINSEESMKTMATLHLDS